MFTMKIESDHDKIQKEAKYTPEEFDALIRKICVETRFTEIGPGVFTFDDEDAALGRMIVLRAKFDKLGIISNLSKWTTFYDDEGELNELAPSKW